MSRSTGKINAEAKENCVEYIFNNDYENVEAYMGYFKVWNEPEGLNFIVYKNGYTPLTAACEVAENLGIVKLLIKYGADPNMPNDDGITPLEMSILNNSVTYELTKYLLEHGADPTIPNVEGHLPIDIAVDTEEYSVIQLLRDYKNVKSVKSIQRKFREKRTLKRNRAAKSIQNKFRNKRTLKRNKAATNIQSRRRGNLTRKRDYLSRYRSYKPWKGTEATDYYLYTDEDIFDYLRQDDSNFVLKLPSTMEEKYEAWNVNDILKSLKFNIQNHEDLLLFYECLTPEHTLRRDNIDTNSIFIKIGSSQFIVRLPEWLFIHLVYMTPIVLPEPRIYTLKKYKMVNGLVSNKIYDYSDSMVSGDHCNYPKPVQTYELVVEKPEDYMANYVNYLNQPFLEEDYMANYIDMLNDYSAPSLPINISDSSELRRRIDVLRETGYDTDDSDLIREYRRLLEDDEDERPVERRLFDSNSSDNSNDENLPMSTLLEIYYGRRSGNLSQRQRETVEYYLSILEEEPDDYDPSYQPDAESDDSNTSW